MSWMEVVLPKASSSAHLPRLYWVTPYLLLQTAGVWSLEIAPASSSSVVQLFQD